MIILVAIASVVLLVLLISVIRVQTFIAFLISAIVAGLLLGIHGEALLKAIQKGMGDILASIIGIIALGAMLGKLVAKSGAAARISYDLVNWLGKSRLRLAFMISGFIIGLPLFYSVGFLLLAPLVITAAHRSKLPAIYLSIPMLASLSVTQGFLPPHPAAMVLVSQLHASLGKTMFYGIIVSIPAILVSGALFGSTLKGISTEPNPAFVSADFTDAEMPSTFNSFFTVLLPILLIAARMMVEYVFKLEGPLLDVFRFIGDPAVSMLISVLLAMYTLGKAQGRTFRESSLLCGEALKDVASLILIFAGSGALKEVLTAGGVSNEIASAMQHSNLNPLVLGWGIAAIIRVCVGSSTVAGITTAGFILPVLQSSGVDASLMVLSIGAGSMMFAHVNDTGFWLYHEYYRLSIKNIIRTYSLMDTLISITGLIAVLMLQQWLKISG